jgi:hypothetical protein
MVLERLSHTSTHRPERENKYAGKNLYASLESAGQQFEWFAQDDFSNSGKISSSQLESRNLSVDQWVDLIVGNLSDSPS